MGPSMLQTVWQRISSSLPGRRPRPQTTARLKRPSLRLEPLEERALLSATIFTVAGRGTAGFSGDGRAAIRAQLDQPSGLTVDSRGNLFVIDDYNERVR